jgi:hypothetical protein
MTTPKTTSALLYYRTSHCNLLLGDSRRLPRLGTFTPGTVWWLRRQQNRHSLGFWIFADL